MHTWAEVRQCHHLHSNQPGKRQYYPYFDQWLFRSLCQRCEKTCSLSFWDPWGGCMIFSEHNDGGGEGNTVKPVGRWSKWVEIQSEKRVCVPFSFESLDNLVSPVLRHQVFTLFNGMPLGLKNITHLIKTFRPTKRCDTMKSLLVPCKL